MKIAFRLLVCTVAVLLANLPVAANAAGFAISTDGFADNALLPATYGSEKLQPDRAQSCGGTNRAPGFSWTNPPAKTQSYAILEVDPDGRGGLGVDHWVVYNIPASATGINSAEIAAGKYTPGKGSSSVDAIGYRGPCPRIGDAPHHYIVTLFALDATPTLPPGLDHDGFLAAAKGHVLDATTTVFRFQR